MGSKRGRKKEEQKSQKSQKSSKTKTIKSENLDDGDWTICLECGTRLKSKNFSSHLERIHQDLSKIERKKITRDAKSVKLKRDRRAKNRMEKEYIRKKRRKEDIIFISVIIIIFVSVISGYFYYEKYLRTEDGGSESVINGNPPSNNNWLDSYSPRYDIGSTDDDWWVNYPNKYSDKVGTSVNHPDWVRTALKGKMVLIFTHSTDCNPCITQEEDVNKILKKYGSDLTYYNLITSSDEDQDKVRDIYGVYYDPEYPNSIPLTVFVTSGKDSSGNVAVGWHSYVGAFGEDVLESWIKDGIYYFEQNG